MAFFYQQKYALKKTESLKNTNQFRSVYKNGKSHADKNLVMYVLDNKTDRNRFGISVSKKVGNSVVRHHLCRLIRESYRLHEDMFDSGLDIAVVVRRGTDSCTFHEIERSLIHLSEIHHIYKEHIDEKNTDPDDQNV